METKTTWGKEKYNNREKRENENENENEEKTMKLNRAVNAFSKGEDIAVVFKE